MDGEVDDLISLKRIGPATLRFTCLSSACSVSVDVPVDASGTFSVTLPKLTRGGYDVALVQPAEQYSGNAIIDLSGQIGSAPLRDRLFMMENPPPFRGSEDGLKGDQANLRIVLKPVRPLTREESDLLYPPARD